MAKSDTFNAERFWRYFKHDLSRNFRNNALTVLLTGLVPVYVFALAFIFNTAIGYPFWTIDKHGTDLFFGVTSVLFLLFYPISAYANATSQNDGRTFLMLPASNIEKFLSTAVISLIIAPAVFMAIFFGCELILNSAFSSRYVEPAYKEVLGSIFLPLATVNNSIRITGFSTFFLPLMVSSAGLCGCFIFKKGKKAKTFITCAISFILLAIIAILIVDRYDGIGLILSKYGSWIWLIFETVCAIACLTYTYFRMKTIEL